MEETINLKDIVRIILKGKRLIILMIIITLILSSIISWFVIPEKYDSNAVVQIVSDIQNNGIISSYIGTEFTPVVYSERIQNRGVMHEIFDIKDIEGFDLKGLKVNNISQTGLIELTYQTLDANDAQQHLQILMEETKKQMNESVQETLLNLEKIYLNESNNLAKEVESLMEKYNKVIISNELPEVLILQTISSSQFVLNLNEKQTSALASINGSMQSELARLKAEIDIKTNEYRNVLASYQSVKTQLDSFKPDPFIRVIVKPTLSNDPTSPNKIQNLIIGLIIGCILGVIIVFIREYWIILDESE